MKTFAMTLVADLAPPDSSIETTFNLMMFAALAAPFVFGLLILAAAYIHRKRSKDRSPPNDNP